MKKKLFFLILFLSLFFVNVVQAHPYHHSCSSCSYYLVHVDNFEEKIDVENKNYYLISNRTIYYYSNGSRRVYTIYSIFNKNNEIIESDCLDAKYVGYNNKDYFLVKKNKGYKVIDQDGNKITKKNYTSMKHLIQNKLLVKYEKNYGVIDIEENLIIPIKYKSLKLTNNDLFISKLNGYYGIVDFNNNILAKNEYDSIKPLYDTFLLKKEGKYGLSDFSGKIIFKAKYDKIKKLGEYITLKENDKIIVLNSFGNRLDDNEYKKIRLKRNNLEGYIPKVGWREIESNL